MSNIYIPSFQDITNKGKTDPERAKRLKTPDKSGVQLVDKVIDKLPQAVEKDADFVISSSLAYKGTTGLERAKSLKSPENHGISLIQL